MWREKKKIEIMFVKKRNKKIAREIEIEKERNRETKIKNDKEIEIKLN